MLYQEVYQLGSDPNQLNISIAHFDSSERSSETRAGFPSHSHCFYEMDFTCGGRACFEFDNCTVPVSTGSLTFFPPLAVHAITQDYRTDNLCIQFSPRILHNNLPDFDENSILLPDHQLHGSGQVSLSPDSPGNLYKIMQELVRTTPPLDVRYEEKGILPPVYSSSDQLRHAGLLLSLIAELLEHGYLRISNTALNDNNLPQMHQLLAHLIEHPEEKLTMESAAAMVNMSYSNFCRTFKNATGCSYVDFCNLQRVNRAKELLRCTNLSVTEISMRLNFGSVSYFNRIFKKSTGMSPLTYRTGFR